MLDAKWIWLQMHLWEIISSGMWKKIQYKAETKQHTLKHLNNLNVKAEH